MALTVYTSKDNAWRKYVNPLRGLTLERIVSLIEQRSIVATRSSAKHLGKQPQAPPHAL